MTRTFRDQIFAGYQTDGLDDNSGELFSPNVQNAINIWSQSRYSGSKEWGLVLEQIILDVNYPGFHFAQPGASRLSTQN